ncbi:putative calcyphosin [Tribonema minus]|uniref:Putative calcyphosin n=1 Tax=Tribonema minus TaxID=303371 RepID=A0A835YS52_9STRA|nr:putative calcyphosin [Tribonema minus]
MWHVEMTMDFSQPDDRVDQLEEALRRRVDTMTGFASAAQQARELERCFRYFDADGSGSVAYDEFFAAMTRLNFVGVQRELEALFDRYDEDCSGMLNYSELSRVLLGNAPAPLAESATSAVERVRARILELGGANGIRSVTHLLRRMDVNGNGLLERAELCEGLEKFGLTGLDDVPGGDIDRIMAHFDRDGNGMVSVEELHRGLQGTMPRARSRLVRAAFNALSSGGNGKVTVDDVKARFDTAKHPDVVAGRITHEKAKMLSAFERGPTKDGTVHWHEFLEYYKDLSAGVADDSYFELMIRNAWHISGGEGSAANSSCLRVLVHHPDGSQSVQEVKSDLGLRRNDKRAIIAKLRAQGIQAERIELAS